MSRIVESLRGKDKRSIGRSNDVARKAVDNPELFEELIESLLDEDEVLSMRAADAAEKAAAINPELLKPHKGFLLKNLFRFSGQEVRWHVALLLSYLTLNEDEARQALHQLQIWLDHDESQIVKVNSLQSMAVISQSHARFQPRVLRIIREKIDKGAPSVRARCRKLIKEKIIQIN